jgi:heat shock protein HtpX
MLRVNGLFGHIKHNDLVTVYLILCFIVLIQIAAAVPFIYLYASGANIDWTWADPLALKDMRRVMPRAWAVIVDRSMPILILTPFVIAYLYVRSVRLLRESTASQPAQRNKDPQLFETVENLVITAGLPMPRIDIMEVPQLNACTFGFTRHDAVIGVTRGLLNGLSPNELAAVLASQVTQVKNGDMRIVTLVNACIGTIFRFARLPSNKHGFALMALYTLSLFNSKPAAVPFLMVVSLIGGIIFLGGIYLMRSAISHARVYNADAGAIELVKRPEALISALSKMSRGDAMTAQQSLMAGILVVAAADDSCALHPPMSTRLAMIASLTNVSPEQLTRLQSLSARSQLSSRGFGVVGNGGAAVFGRRVS